ncbi:acetate kinase [Campylobacter sp. 19-13652]|uniref:acetate kinase n=1 Tax=Campylobacter sp. 19-13652 TaxID=2840180 RepID=UPI001C746A4B|nr:acetate kinase [Campylobacter sp. 19-13652]BCX79589.1 acetate kinase [Campylobacter sp. 19-13652]
MKILVLNSGSSSIKFQLFLMDKNESIASGLVEKIGEKESYAVLKANGQKYERNQPIANHQQGLEIVSELMKEAGVLHDLSELDGIGHRVVHGGETFKDAALVDSTVTKEIEDLISLAPLHNPANLDGILTAIKSTEGKVPNVVVFDTVFHQSMPEYAYRYAIPLDTAKKYGVRKYGFHGTSHKYITERAAKFIGKPLNEFNAITLHLGNGASMSAIKGGKSIDTTMGLSPLEGLVMGTRSGDIDPAVLFYLVRQGELKADINELDTFLNKKSGMLGIYGSNDMRDVENNMDKDANAKLAFDMFCYRIKKYLGSYYAVLGGNVDAIIFTGGIGENSNLVRAGVTDGLELLGIGIDHKENDDFSKRGTERSISKAGMRVNTLIIPTNEELEIALETKRLISK